MLNNYKIITQEEKKNIKIVDTKDEFYLDIEGTKIRGIRKYDIVREAEQPPILKLEIIIDDADFQQNLDCMTSY